MIVRHLLKQNSVLNTFLKEIRDQDIQKDSMRFRRNLERIGEILSYELSKELEYSKETTLTVLGEKKLKVHSNDIIICSILRAGLPLHQGILNYFDTAENAFISAYRYPLKNDNEFEIKVEYFATPTLDGKTLIIADPMLATGKSMVTVYEAIKKFGTPKKIHIVSVIGSKFGVNFIKNHFPTNTELWIADIDPILNEKGYIVPGLGDAGDLSYGPKL
ncbi:uracil phosphoribosyltransferase [Flavobacteriaceae bacterium]|nr:uracil phosphoribosyltransferase [Flavobacteriaceae bacterium]MDB4497481.1 uracil phosphoribosyltransferase [Flavobacteriaceae bacterium]